MFEVSSAQIVHHVQEILVGFIRCVHLTFKRLFLLSFLQHEKHLELMLCILTSIQFNPYGLGLLDKRGLKYALSNQEHYSPSIKC